MKKIVVILILLITVYSGLAQGKYAGTKKNLIGKIYTDSRKIPGLSGWQFREGTVINPLDDAEMITADVFQRGTNWIVFFSVREDTSLATYTIMDVVEVKNVLKGWQIKTTFCRQNKIENVEIVAVIKWSAYAEFLKPAQKAWRFNRDKKRFEAISIKGIDCLNEGGD